VIPAILWLIERLARRHDVHVIVALQEPRAVSWELMGAVVHNVVTWPRRLSAVRMLLHLHRSSPFDVFHAISAGGPGAVACAAAKICRRPVVVHVAGGELVWQPDIAFGDRRRWSRAMTRTVVRRADCVTAASAPILELARAAGAAPLRVTLGVDTRHWTPSPPRPRPPDRPARLVHVGSLTPVKDHTTLLRAIAEVARSGRPLHLDLVGVDVSGGAVPRLALELGVADRVTFHGVVPQASLVPIVRAADLMVVASRHEAGPVVFLEAAAVGVPSVGTAVGHLRDLAPEGAIVVDIGDEASLAREIEHLLSDDARRLAIARYAQRFALSEDADWTCARFEGLYSELVRAAAGRSRRRP
jgi:glycosyltransferase involved in cell wall biosynthesis